MHPVKIMKVLADKNRLRILNLVSQRELCVCELEVLLGLNQSNLSRHLSKMRSIGIIDASKKAQWVHYALGEDFKDGNTELLTYLRKSFKKMKCCESDDRRLDLYLNNSFTCKIIQKDKDFVIGKINQTNVDAFSIGRYHNE